MAWPRCFSQARPRPPPISLRTSVHEHNLLIGDRPRLPSSGTSTLAVMGGRPERNGQIDLEAVVRDVSVRRIHGSKGTYGFSLDASRAPLGGWYAFWYDIADRAGNVLRDAGNLSAPMSIVQVNQDAAPSVGNDASASWSVASPAWLHPSEVVTLSVPFGDAKWAARCACVTVDLDLERNDGLVIDWSAAQRLHGSTPLPDRG